MAWPVYDNSYPGSGGYPFRLLQSFLLLFVLFSWGLGKFILRFGRLDSLQPLEKTHVCSGLYHKNISTLSSAEGSICHPLPLSLHGRLSSHICLPLVFRFLKKPGVFPNSHTNVPAETDYKQAHIVGCHPTHAKLKALYLRELGPQTEQRPRGARRSTGPVSAVSAPINWEGKTIIQPHWVSAAGCLADGRQITFINQ